LSLGYINDSWQVILPKGQFKKDDLVVYIPESSIVPNNLLEQMGLVGKLSGPQKNKVKTIKLRGEISIGLVHPAPPNFKEGDSVAEYYGITKYEPVIPYYMTGQNTQHPPNFIKYDIENINNYNWLIPGEEVSISLKAHGTNCSITYFNDKIYVSSRNCTLLEDDNNIYWKVVKQSNLGEKLKLLPFKNNTITLHGEIIGKGIQNYHYGFENPVFRAFDLRFGMDFVNKPEFFEYMKSLDIPVCPELYRGPFSMDKVKELASGMETLSGKFLHINEGVVVTPTTERNTYHGRVFLKYINPEYSLQKDITEYH
jgi:RNA ligase (TIGR02306 family)